MPTSRVTCIKVTELLSSPLITLSVTAPQPHQTDVRHSRVSSTLRTWRIRVVLRLTTFTYSSSITAVYGPENYIVLPKKFEATRAAWNVSTVVCREIHSVRSAALTNWNKLDKRKSCIGSGNKASRAAIIIPVCLEPPPPGKQPYS
jgi:hypothetical protein